MEPLTPQPSIPIEKTHRSSHKRVWFVLWVLVILGGILFMLHLHSAMQVSDEFPTGKRIVIESGSDMKSITDLLQTEHVIQSAESLKLLLWMSGSADDIKAGTYIFTEPLSAGEVANAITTGLFIEPPVRITIPEGLRGNQIVEILKEKFEATSSRTWDADAFDAHIGYLFPDTYLVYSDVTEEEVIKLMQDTFTQKLAPLEAAIATSTLTREEVIILASIVEREADSEVSMRTVSGILQKRLKLGMALQVDATFHYLLGKESHELTGTDLELDSPYNTYEYPGLPPTPISNPGLMAINAVLDPIETKYLYYLTGSDGTFHYATTFEEHKRNKELYLK